MNANVLICIHHRNVFPENVKPVVYCFILVFNAVKELSGIQWYKENTGEELNKPMLSFKPLFMYNYNNIVTAMTVRLFELKSV